MEPRPDYSSQTTTTQQSASQQPWTIEPTPAGQFGISHPWAASPHAYVAPLLLEPGKIRGKLSEYREGWICMVPEGFLLSGKVVASRGAKAVTTQAGAQVLFGFLFGAMVADHVLGRPRADALPWNCVEEIVLKPRKGRLCVVYHLPETPDKPFSLGLRLAPPPLYQHFVQVATHYLGPEKVHEGKIKPPQSPVAVWILLGFIVVMVLLIVILGNSK